MPPSLITLVRHGEAEHNVGQRYHLADPFLTARGVAQCETLPARLPAAPPVDLLVTSPLKRTVQTTLVGFAPQLKAGVPALALPELQETADLPCDTGSPRAELEAVPGFARVDFARLQPGWNDKRGRWSAAPEALAARAADARRWLQARDEAHVVCVLHGGFLHYLTEDWTGHGDLPGTGWSNTEFRQYVQDDTENAGLKETEESKACRTKKPLTTTEKKELDETKGGEGAGASA